VQAPENLPSEASSSAERVAPWAAEPTGELALRREHPCQSQMRDSAEAWRLETSLFVRRWGTVR
jgi:hypothetical protein